MRGTTLVTSVLCSFLMVLSAITSLTVTSARPASGDRNSLKSLEAFTSDGPSAGPGNVSGTLYDNATVGVLSPNFWSINGQTKQNRSFTSDLGVGTFLNSTPIGASPGLVRYGQLSDFCDVANNSLWAAGPTSGTIVGGCQYNITSFKAWCYWRVPL
jgi:hypothetical protein